MRSTRLTIITSAALLALAGTAAPILAADEPRHTAHSVLSINDDTYEVIAHDGSITSVKLNGQLLPPSRYTHENDQVIIRDASNNILARVSIALTAEQAQAAADAEHAAARTDQLANLARLRGELARVQADQSRAAAEVMAARSASLAPPKVMLGITFNDESNTDDDGTERRTLTITRVGPGLPAHRAGLQPNDVILKIDGTTNPSGTTLSDKLKNKNPGDLIDLRIRRNNAERDVQVRLDAYNEELLDAVTAEDRDAAAQQELELLDPDRIFRWNFQYDPDQVINETMQQVEDILQRHRVFERLESARADLLDDIRSALQQARHAVNPALQELLELQGGSRPDRLVVIPRAPVAPIPPPMPTWVTPSDRTPGFNAQADALENESRLDSLESKVNDLDTKLERLIDLLESRHSDDRRDH